MNSNGRLIEIRKYNFGILKVHVLELKLTRKTTGIHLTQWEACLWAFGLLTFIRHFKTDHIIKINNIYTKITIKSESKRKSFGINPNENEILKK